MKIMIDLHILRFPESEKNHIFSGCVCVCVVRKQITIEASKFDSLHIYHL